MARTTHPDTTAQVLAILREGRDTGRDGHPATYLAIQLDALGAHLDTLTLEDFVDDAYGLLERLEADETTALRYADDDECCASRIEATLDRIHADALSDLEHLASHLAFPAPLALTA